MIATIARQHCFNFYIYPSLLQIAVSVFQDELNQSRHDLRIDIGHPGLHKLHCEIYHDLLI